MAGHGELIQALFPAEPSRNAQTKGGLMTYRFLVVLLTTGTMFAQVDVLTRRVDNLRSGVNSHETTLTQDAVQNRVGKLCTLFADAKIMAQPLYCHRVVSAMMLNGFKIVCPIQGTRGDATYCALRVIPA